MSRSSDDDEEEDTQYSETEEESDYDGDNPWVAAVDSKSGRTYFFHRETRETRWKLPREFRTSDDGSLRSAVETSENAVHLHDLVAAAREKGVVRREEPGSSAETSPETSMTDDTDYDSFSDAGEEDHAYESLLQRAQSLGAASVPTDTAPHVRLGSYGNVSTAARQGAPRHMHERAGSRETGSPRHARQPSGPVWHQSTDKRTGKHYYFHVHTKETRWSKPDEYIDTDGAHQRRRVVAAANGQFSFMKATRSSSSRRQAKEDREEEEARRREEARTKEQARRRALRQQRASQDSTTAASAGSSTSILRERAAHPASYMQPTSSSQSHRRAKSRSSGYDSESSGYGSESGYDTDGSEAGVGRKRRAKKISEEAFLRLLGGKVKSKEDIDRMQREQEEEKERVRIAPLPGKKKHFNTKSKIGAVIRGKVPTKEQVEQHKRERQRGEEEAAAAEAEAEVLKKNKKKTKKKMSRNPSISSTGSDGSQGAAAAEKKTKKKRATSAKARKEIWEKMSKPREYQTSNKRVVESGSLVALSRARATHTPETIKPPRALARVKSKVDMGRRRRKVPAAPVEPDMSEDERASHREERGGSNDTNKKKKKKKKQNEINHRKQEQEEEEEEEESRKKKKKKQQQQQQQQDMAGDVDKYTQAKLRVEYQGRKSRTFFGDWRQAFDAAQGKVYFYNRVTREVRWDAPAVPAALSSKDDAQRRREERRERQDRQESVGAFTAEDIAAAIAIGDQRQREEEAEEKEEEEEEEKEREEKEREEEEEEEEEKKRRQGHRHQRSMSFDSTTFDTMKEAEAEAEAAPARHRRRSSLSSVSELPALRKLVALGKVQGGVDVSRYVQNAASVDRLHALSMKMNFP